MTGRLAAYCLGWHVHQSSAFQGLLVKPLEPYVEVQLEVYNRAARRIDDWGSRDAHAPIIFCLIPPPA